MLFSHGAALIRSPDFPLRKATISHTSFEKYSLFFDISISFLLPLSPFIDLKRAIFMRVVSGIQPSGKVHLGNYFGALRNWVSLQEKGNECFFFIANLHSLTVYQTPEILRQNTRDLVATLLAIGIDPQKSALFLQSDIQEHAELCWVLSCLAPHGELERMIQFKEKSEHNPHAVNAGLFLYPVLQAADILLYNPDVVPVGRDQEQHLELTRTLARKFNATYGEFFKEPATLQTKTMKIIGLDGVRKMSKSFDNYIAITETRADLEKKLRAAATDPARVRRSDPGNPGVCNVFSMHELFSLPETQEWAASGCRSAAIGCSDCKKSLLDSLDAFIAPIREKYEYYAAQPALIDEVLQSGAQKAREVARATCLRVREKLGI